ncbi:MAG: hypothetical protein IPK82_19165 [Polyangiaceae bacterium]|nr:hypothetical protein [Polyangiaceae bacterium]
MLKDRVPTTTSTARTLRGKEGVIETVITGRLTEHDMRAAIQEISRLGVGAVWLADASAMESYETACVKVTSEAIAMMEKKGLKRVVAVIKSSLARMAVRAVAMTTKVEVKVVESRLEALPLLKM